VITTKPGVLFTIIAPGGFHILAALDYVSLSLGRAIEITSACDGIHSAGGPIGSPNPDPHYTGNAYDIHTHSFTDPEKQLVLAHLKDYLGDDKFYMFLEYPNTPNEHIHIQVKNGATYP
jgi:hypothetical protein